MRDDKRIWAVRKMLDEYVRSLSLRHIRDPGSLARLSRDIVNRLDEGNSIWRKWNEQREVLIKPALPCWVPIEDMQGYLNQMSGPRLTRVDVEQRLRAFEEEEYFEHRNQAFQKRCLTIYRQEKAKGTELTAIVGLLRDYVQELEDRTRVEEKARYRYIQDQKRVRREQLLVSGADCNWTQIEAFPYWYCRKNGRTYRLSPSKDRRWTLHEVSNIQDTNVGLPLGKYASRREATKAIRMLAYS